jgi:hypothetical protein
LGLILIHHIDIFRYFIYIWINYWNDVINPIISFPLYQQNDIIIRMGNMISPWFIIEFRKIVPFLFCFPALKIYLYTYTLFKPQAEENSWMYPVFFIYKLRISPGHLLYPTIKKIKCYNHHRKSLYSLQKTYKIYW